MSKSKKTPETRVRVTADREIVELLAKTQAEAPAWFACLSRAVYGRDRAWWHVIGLHATREDAYRAARGVADMCLGAGGERLGFACILRERAEVVGVSE